MIYLGEKLPLLTRQFERDSRGNVAIMFALGVPALAGAALMAVEMSQVSSQQAKLQGIADSAAIAAARELRLGNATKDIVLKVAQSVVDAGAIAIPSPISFSGDVPEDKAWVSVTLSSKVRQSLATSLGLAPSVYSANARARVMGGSPVCAVGLRENQDATIRLDKNARMEARGCAVYSNSATAGSIVAQDSAYLTAAHICAAGGKGGGIANFTPQPTTDCPALPDPLAKRPAPSHASCPALPSPRFISNETITLSPGTYCGGLRITKNSIVKLSPGIYVIKEGALIVDGGSSMKGKGVGFYFTGDGAKMDLKADSIISLEAPVDGVMAGLLFFQDRAMTDLLQYEVSSDDASVLLGTIYLPYGRFYAGGQKPIAQNSAYTIIVAQQINLSAGPTMVLNSNYALTDVPVPDGVGPLASKVQLEE